MLLVQWQRGRKVIIHPEAHTNTGLHDSLPGWRLLRAGAEMLGLTHRNDTTEK
jgi:hypothetical protein